MAQKHPNPGSTTTILTEHARSNLEEYKMMINFQDPVKDSLPIYLSVFLVSRKSTRRACNQDAVLSAAEAPQQSCRWLPIFESIH